MPLGQPDREYSKPDRLYSCGLRLSNELSHLEECLDRGMAPIDIPEIQRIAAHVLEKVKAADPDQYESLMASIGVPT